MEEQKREGDKDELYYVIKDILNQLKDCPIYGGIIEFSLPLNGYEHALKFKVIMSPEDS